MKPRLCVVIVLACLAAPGPQAVVRAAITASQRRDIATVKTIVRRAGSFYKQKKFSECADLIKNAQARVEELATSKDPQVLAQIKQPYEQLKRAHALLELEGVSLPALKAIDFALPATGAPGAAGPISFKDKVAPILISRCGNCHVRNARGMFSMANFESLMKGPPAGFVIKAGDVAASRLIEAVEGKEMPPSGAGIPAAELKVIKDWVAAGARFDGPSPTDAIATYAARNNTPRPAPMPIQRATGNETVSFAKDIAPVLIQNCNGCHVSAQRVRGGLNMTTFAQMIRGGDSGAVILRGNPNNSILIKKLNGTGGGQRMPQGRPPLSPDVLAKITTWIQEGATFDGPQANQSIIQVAALDKANRASHEELSADRVSLAKQNWRLGMANVEAQQAETEHVLLVGNVGSGELQQLGQQAEALVPKVAKVFRAPASDPFIKGRLTLFVFNQRYDYSEFGQMVERREIPRHWRGHWNYSVVDAYGAMVMPRDDQERIDSLLVQYLASGYVASLGTVPQWFSAGSGRAIAARLVPKDARAGEWNSDLLAALPTMKKPDDFATGKLSADATDAASYSFVKFLMTDSKRYNRLLSELRKGTPFDQAFARGYNGSIAQAAAVWIRSAAKDASKRRRR